MLVFCALLLFHLGAGVIVQEVGIPKPTIAGHIARLECLWSTGSGPPLYSLRWCKDGQQFYVVTVRPRPHQAVFPTPGVHVLLSMSDETVLSLTNVTAATSGTYTCEAMSDAPDFLSSARSAHLSVIEVPVSGPTWAGVLSVYHVHQHLRARCHVMGSRPPAVFTFLLNGAKFLHEEPWVTVDTPRYDIRGETWNSSSSLSIPLTPGNILKFFPLGDRRSYYSANSRTYDGPSISGGPSYQSPRIFVSDSNQDILVNDLGSRSTRQMADGSSYYMPASSRSSDDAPTSRAVSFPGSASQTRRLNLTCLANVGGLVYKTTAVSLVSFPTEIHYTSITRGAVGSGPVHSMLTWILLIAALYLTYA
ncbi:uncharacterized protein LOC122256733 [Penaeus japonicus]|uniref:uncharacterized protein LOC122256733 n=1 Tax=Penaeus japonicus TaxID=27405 RepID=UPI001C715823|nr:uncharacterized protein LOC122256733 [Penaeus japonicus]